MSARGYTEIDRIREYLKSINIDIVSTDEEIQRLIYSATTWIEENCRRRFDPFTVTGDRYDDPGVGKLVLKYWPIISVSKVRFYDHSNALSKEWISTDSDWAQKVIIGKENGFLEFPLLKMPFMTSAELFRWETAGGLQPSEWPRQPEFKRMVSAIAWIEVDYQAGFSAIPSPIGDACLKMVVMELLRKKGLSDTQGASSMSIAGFGETWAQGSPQATGPFASVIGPLSTEIQRTFELYRKRRSISISIL